MTPALNEKTCPMVNIIPNITDDQSSALNSMVAQIAKETRAEKIICYGARTNHDFIWSTFLEATDEARSMQCDLVILTQEREKTKRDEICESVTRHNTAALKFTVLVHGIQAINDETKKGSHFFSTLVDKGVVLFDSQAFSLNSPTPIAQIASDIEAYWKNRHDLASNFYQGAVHALLQGWNNQAVFLLHQTVEHACIALIRVYMGYKITTHKLSKLLSMVENFSLYSITVFPRLTRDEVRLFNVLEKAYSGSRYDEKYNVSTETVNALQMEVEEFLQLAQALFIKKTVAGNTSIDKRDVASFESVGLDTFARVVLIQGDQESVEIQSKYGSAKCIQVKEEDKRLWIATTNLAQDKVHDATVYITYKKLSGIVLHHAESVTCKDTIESEWLGIIHNGQGSINLQVDVLTLDVTLNKHGNIILSGSADEAKIFNNRTGDLNAKDLDVTSAKVVIKGSGNVSVHVEDELHTELIGSGNLLLTGSPRIKTMIVKGTGALKIIN